MSPSLSSIRRKLPNPLLPVRRLSKDGLLLQVNFCTALLLSLTTAAFAQQPLVDAPQPSPELLEPSGAQAPQPAGNVLALSSPGPEMTLGQIASSSSSSSTSGATAPQQTGPLSTDVPSGEVNAKGEIIPVSRQQPKRILGLMPNYRTVTGGAVAPRPTAKKNLEIATRQAFDYSSFIFLAITTASAEGLDLHPKLGKGLDGYGQYLWRGFLDKTDGTYQSAFLLPTLLHEDGRYYAMGTGSKWKRLGYAASRVVVTRTYSGRNTFNFAGIGGKVGAQAVSQYYYPPSDTTFGVLATKFGYSIARDVGFTVFREFYPDIATHVLKRKP